MHALSPIGTATKKTPAKGFGRIEGGDVGHYIENIFFGSAQQTNSGDTYFTGS